MMSNSNNRPAHTGRYHLLFLYVSLAVLSFYAGLSKCLLDAVDQQESWRDAPQEWPVQMHDPYQQEQQTKQQQQRLEFIHIPKTGGTAIESVSSHVNITWGICHFSTHFGETIKCSPNRKHNWPSVSNFNRCPWWHVPPTHIETFFPEHNPYSGADLFAVVRNPYDRIVSEYYYRLQQNKKNQDPKMNNAEHFNKKLNELLSTFVSGKRQGHLSQKIPGNKVYFMGSCHLLPQYDFIYDDKHQKIVEHVLHFENLRDDFAGLMAQYDLPMRLPEKMALHSVGKELGVQNLTKKNIQLIETIYWDDFREFGYEVLSLKEWRNR